LIKVKITKTDLYIYGDEYMSNDNKINVAIEFPEGVFIVPKKGGIYFMPDVDSDKAYLGWGQKQELHGKFAHSLPTRSDQFENYDVTYEVEDGSLIAARLITPFSRSAGKLLEADKVKKIEAKLDSGDITLTNRTKAPSIIRAAKTGDGLTVVLVESYSGPKASLNRTLYVGQTGALKPVSDNYVQGGNSFYFNLDDGTHVELPYGYGGPNPNEPPKYGDKLMAYLDIQDSNDLKAFGIHMDAPEAHLDPFCPELKNSPKP
jgi:hypothetical protein